GWSGARVSTPTPADGHAPSSCSTERGARPGAASSPSPPTLGAAQCCP
ncbi:MAG: hypothetical protein AVDCRST_MAG19-1399, partial [uncultured Thermomicrobiales bacterium]